MSTLVPGTPRLSDAVVVGGGVMGSAAAAALARCGLDVVLLEQLGPDADPSATALQDAAAGHGAVLRHHRRVTAVEIGPDGVRVRSAAGATVQARAAVVAVGRRAADLLGLPVQPVQPGGTDGRPVRRFGPVLVAFGAGASGSAAARQLGELLADLTLQDLAGSAVPA